MSQVVVGYDGTNEGEPVVRKMVAADLAHEPFLSGMRTTDLSRLASAARFTEINAGRRLFVEGALAERFWLLQVGTVDVDLHTPDGGRVVIETLGPGSVLGWSWLFRPHRWRFGGVTTTPVRAIEVDGRLVRTLCAVDPLLGYELTRRFGELLVERVEATRTQLTTLPDIDTVGDAPFLTRPHGAEAPTK